jgi:hypothetical protein
MNPLHALALLAFGTASLSACDRNRAEPEDAAYDNQPTAPVVPPDPGTQTDPAMPPGDVPPPPSDSTIPPEPDPTAPAPDTEQPPSPDR